MGLRLLLRKAIHGQQQPTVITQAMATRRIHMGTTLRAITTRALPTIQVDLLLKGGCIPLLQKGDPVNALPPQEDRRSIMLNTTMQLTHTTRAIRSRIMWHTHTMHICTGYIRMVTLVTRRRRLQALLGDMLEQHIQLTAELMHTQTATTQGSVSTTRTIQPIPILPMIIRLTELAGTSATDTVGIVTIMLSTLGRTRIPMAMVEETLMAMVEETL
jgi:hypothetical protein